MKMFATYDEMCTLKFNANGSVAKFNGVTGGGSRGDVSREVILCQSHPFPSGCGDEDEAIPLKIVEFNKELKDIYIDYDDGNEVLEYAGQLEGVDKQPWFDLLPEGVETYAGLKDEQLEGFSMYGSYVKEIKAHEIVAVHNISFDYNKGWLGKPKEFNYWNGGQR